ncbi:dihydropteroate synthase [Evansella sp. AB-P1]|uniref:dihydropteroate synthase n=1 Tax=Evansella sp. AB-P1 TaxID=3037653 RepID=UPI00241D12F4|nr:dihydropteroate synthase [Evansella sp. AB-P1]MDG5790177.1 dihydropteroate synthase [Evansella sp. AB-P1]
MGILNVTPDSFSDGGQFEESNTAVHHAIKMVGDGADIIDVGGESTRPGAQKVEAEEELRRVIDPIKAVREAVNVPISIDTYKGKVAELAIKAGANIINDVWGAKWDPNMASVAAHYDVPIILMHNRTKPSYNNLMDDIIVDLKQSIEICINAGVKEEKIILDPGIGFGKTFEQNVLVMRNLEKITELGYPVLLGTSRKSLIAKALELPVDERMEGTGATVCLGINKGTSIVRVHDVLEMSRMVKMMDIMIGKRAIPLT